MSLACDILFRVSAKLSVCLKTALLPSFAFEPLCRLVGEFLDDGSACGEQFCAFVPIAAYGLADRIEVEKRCQAQIASLRFDIVRRCQIEKDGAVVECEARRFNNYVG